MDLAICPEPFPARTKFATATINGVHTDAMSVTFADKIMITISQRGRLAHWVRYDFSIAVIQLHDSYELTSGPRLQVHVPLDVSIPDVAPTMFSEPVDDELPASDLLPIANLTATTVLGGRAAESDTFGQLLATQIASALKTKDNDEKRMIVFGFGLDKPSQDRTVFMDLITLALRVL